MVGRNIKLYYLSPVPQPEPHAEGFGSGSPDPQAEGFGSGSPEPQAEGLGSGSPEPHEDDCILTLPPVHPFNEFNPFILKCFKLEILFQDKFKALIWFKKTGYLLTTIVSIVDYQQYTIRLFF